MGIFEDMMGDVFGVKPDPVPEKPSGDLMDTLFGGFSTTGHVSGGSSGGLFGFGRQPESPQVGLGGYREPILPAASQAMGYGGQPYATQAEADKSCLMSGVVTDPETGYCGTPQQIYDAYLREGRNPARLLGRYGKNIRR